MKSFRLPAALLLGLFVDCRCKGTEEEVLKPLAVALDGAQPVRLCGSGVLTLTLSGENVGVVAGEGSSVELPTVQLVHEDGTEVGSTVTFLATEGVGGTLTVSLGEALGAGTYDVVLRRGRDGAEQRFEDAVRVGDKPAISRVVGSFVCDSMRQGARVSVEGTGLLGVSGVLSDAGGNTTALALEVAASGTSLSFDVPAALSLGSYDLLLDAGGACQASAAAAVVLGPAPVFSAISAAAPYPVRFAFSGAQLGAVRASSGPLVAGDVTLSFAGTFPVGSELGVDGEYGALAMVQSLTPNASGFDAALTLSDGTHSFSVRAGQCEVSAGSIEALLPTLPAQNVRLSPNAVTSSVGQTLDISGDFSSAAEGLRAYVDTPTGIVALAVAGALGATDNGTLWRFVIPSALPAGRHDVWLLSKDGTGAEVFARLPQALNVDTAAPRIVWQERHLLSADDETLFVTGCNLMGGSFFAQSTSSGARTALSSSSVVMAGELMRAQMRCASNVLVADEARLDVSALAPGRYLIGVENDAGASFSLYQTTRLSSSPTLGAAQSGPSLQKARRLPSVSELSDSTGRRFVVVVGGDTSSSISMNPVVTGSTDATYEYAPLQPDGSLGPWQVGPSTSGNAWPLEGPALYVGPSNLHYAYGAALTSDAARLYLLGGTQNGAPDTGTPGQTTSSDKILTSAPLDPTIRLTFKQTALAAGNVPAGTHHYRAAARFTDVIGTHHLYSDDLLTLQNQNPAAFSITVNLPTSATRTYSRVALYRIDSATLPLSEANMREVASMSLASSGGDIALQDNAASPNSAAPPLSFGGLEPFSDSGHTLLSATFGLSAHVVPYVETSVRRTKLIALGGVIPDMSLASRTVRTTNIAQSITLSDQGLPSADASALTTTNIAGQAFFGSHLALPATTAGNTTIHAVLGIFAADATHLRQSLNFDPTGTLVGDSSTSITKTSTPPDFALPYYAFGFVELLPSRSYVIGGVNNLRNALAAQPTVDIWTIADTVLSSFASLSVRRAFMDSAMTGATAIAISGVRCSGACSTTDDYALDSATSIFAVEP